MASADILPVWKKLYPVISGDNINITVEVIEQLLTTNRVKLVQNLLEYKPYTKESFKTWKNEAGLKDIISDDELCNFIHLLSKELDLDVNVTWMVMCNFLMYEYYGKVDELKSIVKYDTNVKLFADAIWYFYSAERMFLLKTLRYVFENSLNEEHLFYEQYSEFIKSLDMDLLKTNLLKVMKYITFEIEADKTRTMCQETLTRWIHRNHREQVEVVLLLMHVIQHIKLDGKILHDILGIFLKHGFGRFPSHPKALPVTRMKDVSDIKHAEIGCVLTVMNYYWKNPGVCEPLPKDLENDYQLLQYRNEDGIVLFAWAILRISVTERDEALQYFETISRTLLHRLVFKFLHSLIVDPIFAKDKVGDYLIDAVHQLMVEYLKICQNASILFEQPGVSEIIAELIRRKGMEVFTDLGSLYGRALEMFPYIFEPFLNMCRALLENPRRYEKTMWLLRHIPGFLAEIPWDDSSDRIKIIKPHNLFIDSHLFVIPSDTYAERVLYKEYEMVRFIYEFSLFTLLTQFIVSLNSITIGIGTGWYCYDNLKELVRIGFDFINYLLHHYKGDLRADTDLRTLIQRLDVVPTQFSDGPAKNFDLIKLYFQVNVTTVTRNLLTYNEAFPILMRKKCIPQITSFENIDKQMMLEHVHGSSLLMSSLKEEESKGNHSLVLTYFELLHHVIEKDICQLELQVAGVWYVLNVVYPLYQQWPYDDPHQKLLICNKCLEMFIYIIKNYPDRTDSSKPIFDMVVTSFLFEKLTMSIYVSSFLKDKYHLQILMQQQSSWTAGQVLDNIKCIRLQLILLLLLYKQKVNCKKPCTIDHYISEISRVVSTYIINPYSANLRILSCRFLEVLSKDENAPLMALLGLDYDQIQRLFLDRLRDPTEDDCLKMHILELISSCIFHQHGMTAAFFNVKSSRKWYSDNRDKTIEGDTVGDFMVDYLQNIKKSHEYLRNPLQIAILRVMSNLWISAKQHLVSELVSLEVFWPLLSEPLFSEFNQQPSVYICILTIFTVQLHEEENSNTFLRQVEKFVTNIKQMVLWEKYIIGIFKTDTPDEEIIEERRELVEVWTKFILILEKQKNLRTFDRKTKRMFIEMSIGGLHTKLVNMYCIDVWVNLALVLVTNWGIPEAHKDKDLVLLLKDMYSIIKKHYPTQKSQVRSTILAFAFKMITELKKYFQEESAELVEFLDHLGPLIDYEYDVLENDVWKDKTVLNKEKTLFLPWMMCYNIFNALLCFTNAEDISLWFSYHDYLRRSMNTATHLMRNQSTVRIAKIPIYSMFLYVKLPMSLDFVPLREDLKKFYNLLEEPLAVYLSEKTKIPLLTLEEVWSTLTILMKFNRAFAQKFQGHFLKSFYDFQIIFEDIMAQIWCIPQTNVSLKALELLINTLQFYDTFLNSWQDEWYKKHNHTYNNVRKRTAKMINACIYNILRPKDILVFTLDRTNRLTQIERVPIDLTVEIMNRLITAAGLGFSLLYRMNPGLTVLLDILIPDTCVVLVANDFSVPKFDLPIPHNLAYGRLLCLAHFLCKALDAHTEKGEKLDVKEVYERYSDRWACLVEHQGLADHLHHQELSTYLRYAMYEYSGLTDPWIQQLDQNNVRVTLEIFMAFLGQQIFMTIQMMEPRQRQCFKRNLISELQFFFEFVKKHSMAVISDSLPAVVASQGHNIAKTDIDMFQRYLVHCKQNRKPVTDELLRNFCISMSHWFTQICSLQ